MTPSAFRTKQKELLGEVQRQTGAQATWTDPQLDSWRDDELALLYSKGLFRVGSTRTLAGWTETLVPTYTTGTVQRYFPLPATMRRVYKIELIDPNTDEVVKRTFDFDSGEDSGFVRLDLAMGYEGYKIRLFGEIEYTIIDTAPAEIADVAKIGSVIRALVGQYVQSQRANRTRQTNNAVTANPRAITAVLAFMTRLYENAQAHARSIQDTRVYG